MTDMSTRESDAVFVTSAMVDRACEAFDPIGLFRPKAELAVRMKGALVAALTKPAAPIQTEKGDDDAFVERFPSTENAWEHLASMARIVVNCTAFAEPFASRSKRNSDDEDARKEQIETVLCALKHALNKVEALARRAQPAADQDEGRAVRDVIVERQKQAAALILAEIERRDRAEKRR